MLNKMTIKLGNQKALETTINIKTKILKPKRYQKQIIQNKEREKERERERERERETLEMVPEARNRLKPQKRDCGVRE
jgi:hypothetical protein